MPDAEPMPPRYPGRVKRLLYGFAERAEADRITELKALAGGR